MRFNLTILALLALVPVASAHASEEVLFGPLPDWVEDRRVDLSVSDEGDAPVRLIQSDTQMLLEPDTQTVFTSIQMQFQSPQGLSAANISLPWRSETDELTVHRVRILRGDEVIDVLEEGQTFTVLRREESLEQSVLTGVLTANMFPDGIEVGDVLDIAYSLRSEHPVLKGHAEATFGPFLVPADHVSLRVLWPASTDIRLSQTRGLPEWKRGKTGKYQFAAFSMDDVEPIIPPSGAPARYEMVRFAEASDYSSWSDVAQLFAPLYREASRIPDEGPLRKEVEKIRAATQVPAERAEMALALVQDRVRYVALAMGAGGLMPADAATTWSRRYGDCKGKTALLLGILHELEIDAEPLAVQSIIGDTLPTRLPSVGAFDHILVRSRIGGETYFLDGTRTGDTKLERIAIPNFVWGLPIVSGGAELIPMVPAALALPQEETTIRIDASSGLFAEAPTEMNITLRGDSAIFMRATVNQLVGEGRRKALEDYWKNRFDFVTPVQVDVQSNEEAGEFTLSMTGTSELDWDGTWLETSGMRVGYNADFSRQEGPDKDAPFAVAHPMFSRMTQIVTLPPGFDADDISGEEVNQTLAGVEYRREYSLENNVFTAIRSTRSIASEISAAEARQAESKLTALREKRLFLRMPDRYLLSWNDLNAIKSNPADDADELVGQADTLITAGRWDDAIHLLDLAIEREPENQWAWANRAVALAQKGDFAAAEQAAARTETIEPRNYVMWHARGLIALRRSDYDLAVEAFSRAIEIWPNDTWALNMRSGAYFNQDNYEAGLVDARRIQEIDPQMYVARLTEIQALRELGRVDEARAQIEVFIEKISDLPEASVVVSEMYAALGDYDRSEAVLAEAKEGDITAPMLMAMASRRGNDEVGPKIAELSQALEIDPKFVPALIARAHVYWREYDLKKAIVDADAAIALAPKSYAAYDVKARALIDLGRTREAVKVADELAKALPEDALALATAAQIFREANYVTRFKELIARALKLAPEEWIIQQIAEGSIVSIENVGMQFLVPSL